MVNTKIRLFIFLAAKMEKFYTVSKNKTRSWLWLRSWIPIAKFRLKLKKVGKTTRPFRYDLNQIPYDYTLEARNRLKGLDLIDRVPDELWNEVRDIVQETGIKTIPMEKKCKKVKWRTTNAMEWFYKGTLFRTDGYWNIYTRKSRGAAGLMPRLPR